jgi:hypothetical protein
MSAVFEVSPECNPHNGWLLGAWFLAGSADPAKCSFAPDSLCDMQFALYPPDQRLRQNLFLFVIRSGRPRARASVYHTGQAPGSSCLVATTIESVSWIDMGKKKKNPCCLCFPGGCDSLAHRRHRVFVPPHVADVADLGAQTLAGARYRVHSSMKWGFCVFEFWGNFLREFFESLFCGCWPAVAIGRPLPSSPCDWQEGPVRVRQDGGGGCAGMAM